MLLGRKKVRENLGAVIGSLLPEGPAPVKITRVVSKNGELKKAFMEVISALPNEKEETHNLLLAFFVLMDHPEMLITRVETIYRAMMLEGKISSVRVKVKDLGLTAAGLIAAALFGYLIKLLAV